MTTLLQLRTRARQLADMVNSQFVSDAELTSMVNASYQELYDLVLETDQGLYVSDSTFTLTTSDSGRYSIPATVYKVCGIDYQVGSEYLPLQLFQWAERGLRNRSALRLRDRNGLQYRLVGNYIQLDPSDNSAGSYKLWYTPALTLLSADSDAIDTWVSRAGWEEYIAIDCALKMKEKEESDTSGLQRMKDRMALRVVNAGSNRNVGDTIRVSDSRRAQVDDLDDFWY
jgi:hypothetical protein